MSPIVILNLWETNFFTFSVTLLMVKTETLRASKRGVLSVSTGGSTGMRKRFSLESNKPQEVNRTRCLFWIVETHRVPEICTNKRKEKLNAGREIENV